MSALARCHLMMCLWRKDDRPCETDLIISWNCCAQSVYIAEHPSTCLNTTSNGGNKPHTGNPPYLWTGINLCLFCNTAPVRILSGERPSQQDAVSQQPAMERDQGTTHVRSQNVDCMTKKLFCDLADDQLHVHWNISADDMLWNDTVSTTGNSSIPVLSPERLEVHRQANLATTVHFRCITAHPLSTHVTCTRCPSGHYPCSSAFGARAHLQWSMCTCLPVELRDLNLWRCDRIGCWDLFV